MNILHLCHNYYPSKGGPQYTMKHLSEKFVHEYGDTVNVYTTNSYYGPESVHFKKIEPAFEIINGVCVQRFPFRRWHYPLIKFSGKVYGKLTGQSLPYSIRKLRSGLDSPSLTEALNTADADVIMATTILYNFCDYPSWRFTTNKPKPFVLYGALHIFSHHAVNPIHLQRALIADCYIANTEFEKEELAGMGVTEDKICVTGTGIEISGFACNEEKAKLFRQKNNIAESDVVIGYAGSLKKGKGLDVLTDAFRKLYSENKRVKLLVAGSSNDFSDALRNMRDKDQLPLIILENFSDEEKPVIYNAIDLLVLPSTSESFGVVFLEAWACRKPVVGADIGSTKNLISNGVDGFLFLKKNSDSLKKVIDEFVSNKDLRQKAGENGFQKVLHNFNWQTVTGKYRDAYCMGIENFKRLQSEMKYSAIASLER